MFAQRNPYMTDAEKEELKKEILAVTPLSVIPPKSEKKGHSDKAIKVRKVLDNMPSDFSSGKKKEFLVKYAEAILGEKLEVSDFITGLPRLKPGELKKFMAIVPEENTNGHEYALGKVVIVDQTGNDYAVMETGVRGNHIKEEDCRYATAEELTLFLDKLQKNVDVNTIVTRFGGK